MTATATASKASLDDLRALTLWRLEALHRLTWVLGAIVKTFHRLVRSGPDGMFGPARGSLIFNRLCRAAWLIQALDEKLSETLEHLETGAWPEAKVEEPAKTARPQPATASERLGVERGERVEGVVRLDTYRLRSILKRPVEEIVARIFDDLGVFPAWRRLAESAWSREDFDSAEAEEILAGPVTWPPPASPRKPAAPSAPQLTINANPFPRRPPKSAPA